MTKVTSIATPGVARARLEVLCCPANPTPPTDTPRSSAIPAAHKTPPWGQRAASEHHRGNNTTAGFNALLRTTSGGFNTASGYQALRNLTAGSRNLALGYNAGARLTSGGQNIYVGNTGVASESTTVRLGGSPTG